MVIEYDISEDRHSWILLSVIHYENHIDSFHERASMMHQRFICLYKITWLRTSFSQYSVISNEYNAVDLSPLQRERVGWGEIKNSSTLKKQKNLI